MNNKPAFNVSPLLVHVEHVIRSEVNALLSDFMTRYHMLEETHDQVMNLPSVRNELNRKRPLDEDIDTVVIKQEKVDNPFVSSTDDQMMDMLRQITHRLDLLNEDVRELKRARPTENLDANEVLYNISSLDQEEPAQLEQPFEPLDQEEEIEVIEAVVQFEVNFIEEPEQVIEEQEQVIEEQSNLIEEEVVKEELEEVVQEQANLIEEEVVQEQVNPVQEEELVEEELVEEELVQEEELEEDLEDEASVETETKPLDDSDVEEEEESKVEEPEKEEPKEGPKAEEPKEGPKAEEPKEEEEEEEELFEIEIDDKTYCTNNEENGFIWELTEDGEQGDKIGYLKDGEAIFYEDEN